MDTPDTPPPGSNEARKRGCCCPVLDNGHGRRDDGFFVLDVDCTVHPPSGTDDDR